MFVVYKFAYEKDGNLITRQLICFKNNNELIFTDFHKYIGKSGYKNITSDGNSQFYFIVQLLNYVFIEDKIVNLKSLKVSNIKNFIKAYCDKNIDELTVRRCVATIIQFCKNLIKNDVGVSFKESDIFEERERIINGRIKKRCEPAFDVVYTEKIKEPLVRDIPVEAFQILIAYFYYRHPELLMLVAAGAFAGLRPSEACNLTKGTVYYSEDLIQIDLRRERNIRSDNVSVGKIKRERIQIVPPEFAGYFNTCWTRVDEYRDDNNITCNAYSLNSRGKPITYQTYRYEFQKIIKTELVPIFLSSDNVEVATFGNILMDRKLGMHAFRHFYTVQLALSRKNKPVDQSYIMTMRGDKSNESALIYLQNKGDIIRQIKSINEKHILPLLGKIND